MSIFSTRELKTLLADVKKIKKPRLPIDVFLQEAHDLYVWARDDREALMAVGFDPDLLDNIPSYVEMLQQAQSMWMKAYHGQKEVKKEWTQRLTEAKVLRKDLVRAMRYAFRGEDDLLAKLTAIGKGNTQANLIQDMSDLAVVGEAHWPKLKAIGYEHQQLENSERFSVELSIVLARYNAQKAYHEELELRNQAYTLLWEAAQALRSAGRYAFRNNPHKLVGYQHKYFGRK